MTTDPLGDGSAPRSESVPASGHRELRPSFAAAGAGILAAVTWTLWSTSASRLSLFVCVATVAVGLVDLVWSQVATKRVRLTVTANPAEAIVGDRVALRLTLDGPRQFLSVRLRSFASAEERNGVDVPWTGTFTGVANAREVRTDVVVEVLSHGLAGLVACAQWKPVPLARPLAVGPRPLPAAEPLPDLYRSWGEGEARPAASGDLVRGVRPYLAGDPQRRVHWRATARAGELVVKEVEDSGTPRLVIVLELGNGGPAAERGASRAAWYALEGVQRGYSVVLATAEREGGRHRTVIAPVSSPSELIRRLAAATGPASPMLPDDDPATRVLVVTPRGDSWR